jgi:predicted kinase
MRTLVLMRGAPGCSKTTWIQQYKLEQYSISPDNIRTMIQSPVMNLEGKFYISQSNDKRVWSLLFEILEDRMKRGEFTIIDATHSKSSDFSKYKKLIDLYRYRLVCIDFTNVPIEVCKERNRNRDPYKFVPEHVIDMMYSRFKNPIPGFVKVIKPEEFDTLLVKPIDYNKFKRIHHIGDIHGCYTVLMKYLEFNKFHPHLIEDELYIFLGDYIDRGIENAEVIRFLMSICEQKNVLLLEGNHSKHIKNYAFDQEIVSREAKISLKQIEDVGITKKELRNFCRHLGQLAYYTYNDQVVLVNHGGISSLNTNPLFISSNEFIKGVGKYEDKIDDHWIQNNNYFKKVVQIRGHRNIYDLPTKVNDLSYCLEGKIEFGGDLRCVTLTKEEGFQTHEIRNTVFRVNSLQKVSSQDQSVEDLLFQFQSNPKYIMERKCGNISSFNFTREVFGSKLWNSITHKARGMFINTNTKEIVCRGFDKFFNLNETPETKLSNLPNKLVFPLEITVKENGFLGLLGYDSESDDLIFTSKGSMESEHSKWFKDIFGSKYSNTKHIKEYLKNNNCCLLFEVIDPINDPHIIEHKEQDIVLIDIVRRTPNYESIPDDLGQFNKVKYLNPISNMAEFMTWYHQVNVYSDDNPIEGYVIKDQNNFMFKIKLPYYSFWKYMRDIKEVITKGKEYNIKKSSLFDKRSNDYFNYIKSLDPIELKEMSLIESRNKFYDNCNLCG